LIGEFSYPVWNIAINEQSSDRPRDWWSDQVAASVSSNEQHFFSNILQNLPELVNFHSCTVHFDNIESFIYPTDVQIDCSKNVTNYIKIYVRDAPTCLGFPQQSSGCYYMYFN
jgi:hypothetical protein